VLSIVEACTDADTIPKPPWRHRKERYIAHLQGATGSARLVSCADKLHNARAIVTDLRALGDCVFERFTAGRDGTLWYYRTLATTFAEGGPAALAAELSIAVNEMERLSSRR
jgi:GTP pyrophosphokinase